MVSTLISQKLFHWNKSQARESMKTICQTQWSCVVSFLYFAQAMKFKVYEGNAEWKMKNVEWKTIVNSTFWILNYKEALLNADLVFIDGIAMQIFDWVWQFVFGGKRVWTENLNGTDFTPYILEQTRDQKVAIIMSTVYDPKIEKWPEWMDKGLDKLKVLYPHIDIIFKHQTLFGQRGEDFPFEKLQQILNEKKSNYDHILFLNGIGSPVQETWTEQHRNFFDQSGIIVMNNGATLDYYSWFETRAPQRVIKLRVGETLWRVCTQPKKNLHKFLVMFQIVYYWRYLAKQFIKKS